MRETESELEGTEGGTEKLLAAFLKNKKSMFIELGQGEGRGTGVIGSYYEFPPRKKGEERELTRTAGKAAF